MTAPFPAPLPDLATSDDVAKRWRPLSSQESDVADQLCGDASDRLRVRFPDIDVRIVNGLLPARLVASVIAQIVKRALQNPTGAKSDATGPYVITYQDAVGSMSVLDSDIADLVPPHPLAPKIGSIKVHHGPMGRPWSGFGVGPVYGGGVGGDWAERSAEFGQPQ